MMDIIDKRARARLFRERLNQAMQACGLSQSALAKSIGVDRSTVSQLLGGDGARLPNAHVVGACASALKVSADWLLALSERPESAADLLATSLSMSQAPRALVDEQIFAWHQEAKGYKIRHVPATLPDMLKTEDMVVWEYAPHLGRTSAQVIGASKDRLDWMSSAHSDYEIAFPISELRSFLTASGYYAGLSQDIRRAQVAHLLDIHASHYPRLRIYMFDSHRLFSAPVTVFGPLLSAVYLGQYYVTFRDTERVSAFTQHFDTLVREADISARDFGDYLSNAAREAGL
ncbi:helix-turn-helix domain-containing protein [Planktotalea arctica]|uniref:helix-turn-helix domain-containing protein n=1 Tax=Planktotalea arctica TaxID=1481893 RepID=UPI000A16F4AD|nr:helix-turn-helix transcriptional regulator [Planktotalea arctica]